MKRFFLCLSTFVVIAAGVKAQSVASLQSQITVDGKTITSLNQQRRDDRKEIKKLNGPEVSLMSKQSFATDFGNVDNVTWSRLDNYDEADFLKNGKAISAFYDYNANLVGTTQNKSFSDIPQKAQNDIARWYKGYTPVDVVFFDDNEANDTDMILYGTQFDDQDSYFVEMVNGTRKIVLHVTMDGGVDFFTRLR
jgi:hypothetical protein